MEEQDWIIRAKHGDLKAFEKVVDLCHRRVFSFAYVRLKNREDASDITQEVFWRVFTNFSKYDETRSFFSWLFTVEMNIIRDFIRRRKAKGLVLNEDFFENLSFHDNGYLSVEDKMLLFKNLEKLTEEDRQIILFKYTEDLSLREIGEILGIKEDAAKVRLFRAKERLKKLIEKEENGALNPGFAEN